MKDSYILTIAVPTFNMESCLAKNLESYYNESLFGKLEVLVLNNASQDRSSEIAEEFCRRAPTVFRLINRSDRSYGTSVNEAIHLAKGRFFRIVDADDWVNTEDLIKLIHALDHCVADVALTNYALVDMCTGNMVPIVPQGVMYYTLFNNLDWPKKTLPSIHGTTYRTQLLRDCNFHMQDGLFFVDEEYVVLPYLQVSSVIYYPFDVYRYQVANPNQSTSPHNRAYYQEHRERILRRLISAYYEAVEKGASPSALDYCYERIRRGAGDHFTTLYMYVEDRQRGAKLARAWSNYLKQLPEKRLYCDTRRKAELLHVMNTLRLPLGTYLKIKKTVRGRSS